MRVKAKKILITVAIVIAGCLLVAQFVTIWRTNPPLKGDLACTTASQIPSQGSLLRLPFQRNPVALVHLRRSGLMVGRARCGTRTPRAEFLGVGILLSRDPTTKASVDGQSVARRKHAAVELSHTPSGRRPDAERLGRVGTMDRGGDSQPTGPETNNEEDSK